MKAAVKPTFTDPVLQERLAKYLVQRCFRNSVLEDLHAGIAPSSKTGDYSDVMVCTPFGDIAWDRLSRLDDAEMKRLMIDVVDRTYQFIHQLFDPELGGELLRQLAARDPVPGWENPRELGDRLLGSYEASFCVEQTKDARIIRPAPGSTSLDAMRQ